MTPPAVPWLGSCLDAARRLGERRGALLCLLLLLNALALPYAGFVHDARLYGLQVLNRVEGGTFDEDLFLRYGSQDRFSLFSVAAAPLASALGLPWTFFFLYLLSNVVFYWGALRLVERLIDDRGLAVVALIFVAVTPLPFGGFRIFHVNENFLTPRVLATALVLHTFADLLGGRSFRPLLLLAVAFALHPILALTGAGMYVVWQGATLLPRRWFCGLLAAATLGALAVLWLPPLAWRLFGRMDAEWLGGVWVASAYNFPLDWKPGDWFDVAVTLALPTITAAALWRESPGRARFLASGAFLAAAGLLATTVASVQGYALLFQAQPYRALWVVKILQGPLSILLAARLWGRGTEGAKLLALLLLGHLGLTTFMPLECAFPLAVLPLAVLVCRGLEREPRRADWLSRSVAVSLAFGLLGWAAYKAWVLFRFGDQLWEHVERAQIVIVVLAALGPAVWMLVGLTGARAVVRRLGSGLLAAGVCAALALAVQLVTFAVPRSEVYRTAFSKYHGDLRFVAEVLRREAPGRAPTVYWPVGRVDLLWLELRVKSYFERLQVVGVLFSRETALEGVRRARVVAGFEAERLREEKSLHGDREREILEALFGVRFDTARATRTDLERLCRDDAVEFVVVPHRHDGLYCATNGRFYVYDCRRVRAALGSSRAPDGALSRAVNPVNPARNPRS